MISAFRAFILLMPVLAQVEFVRACEDGWSLNPVTGMCYMVAVENKLSWVEAVRACERMNAQLAVLDNEEDNSFVKDLAMLMTAGRENVWIGAQNMDQQSITHFVWLGEAMVGPFTDWAEGEPNNLYNGTEHCLQLFWADDYEWNDQGCFKTECFVCQKPGLHIQGSKGIRQ